MAFLEPLYPSFLAPLALTIAVLLGAWYWLERRAQRKVRYAPALAGVAAAAVLVVVLLWSIHGLAGPLPWS